MPRTKSAKKAERASLRKRGHNLVIAAGLDRLLRGLKKTEEPTGEQHSTVQKAIDKAAKTGLMHPRKADRMKSRLLKTRTGPRAIVKATKKKTTKKKSR